MSSYTYCCQWCNGEMRRFRVYHARGLATACGMFAGGMLLAWAFGFLFGVPLVLCVWSCFVGYVRGPTQCIDCRRVFEFMPNGDQGKYYGNRRYDDGTYYDARTCERRPEKRKR